MTDTIESLRTELAQERAKREAAEAETDVYVKSCTIWREAAEAAEAEVVRLRKMLADAAREGGGMTTPTIDALDDERLDELVSLGECYGYANIPIGDVLALVHEVRRVRVEIEELAQERDNIRESERLLTRKLDVLRDEYAPVHRDLLARNKDLKAECERMSGWIDKRMQWDDNARERYNNGEKA